MRWNACFLGLGLSAVSTLCSVALAQGCLGSNPLRARTTVASKLFYFTTGLCRGVGLPLHLPWSVSCFTLPLALLGRGLTAIIVRNSLVAFPLEVISFTILVNKVANCRELVPVDCTFLQILFKEGVFDILVCVFVLF